MLRNIRGFWRTFWLALSLVSYYLGWRVGSWLIRDAAKRMRFRSWLMRSAGGSFANILGVKLQHEGSPPPSPCFWICNHVSSLDAVMLLLTVENPIVVARHDVQSWPVIGKIASDVGTIFVDRSRFDAMPLVAQKMEQSMQQGYSVVMFPEATTGKGDVLLPFKAPLFEPAVRLNVPVHYACCYYETAPSEPPATEIVTWWRESTFASHAWDFLRTPYIYTRVRYGEQPIQAENRKALARQLQDAVQGLFEPIR
ncbi:MAG: 1-acyl-sn-glycerol-3-phosphate acyltransferase [Anaerolineae bacterium]|nr:1-acyl-sn-glycerol-3-phosphate acyltransferase [Anaerolineae bacterium]